VSLQRKSQLKHQLKLPRQRPQPQNNLSDNDDLIIDDEVTFGRNLNARNFGKVKDEDPELSEYVKFRLWLARQLALAKYREVHG
jgi:hypothetical protein